MTINRKEKVLIFILILFLLVGGTYTLGIMPKNNDKKPLRKSCRRSKATSRRSKSKPTR